MIDLELKEEIKSVPLWRPFGFPICYSKTVVCCYLETLQIIAENNNVSIPWDNCEFVALLDDLEVSLNVSCNYPVSKVRVIRLKDPYPQQLEKYELVVLAHNWHTYIKACNEMVRKGFRCHYVLAPIPYNLGFTTTHRPDYLEENYYKLKQVYNILSDKESKKILVSRVKSIITGNVGYLYLSNFDEYFHPLCSPRKGDIVIDGGVSDYVQQQINISKAIGNSGLIIGFEPDLKGYMEALAKLKDVSYSNIVLLPYGLWSCLETVPFVHAGQGSHVVTDTSACNSSNCVTSLAKMVTIDYIVSKMNLPKIDFIKLDVEGSEINALIGGLKTIIRHRPRMAICIYHELSDLWEIPLFISKLNLNYKFFLGHHQACLHETILYCVP